MIYFQIKSIRNGALLAENIREFPRHFDFEGNKICLIKKEKIRSGYKIVDSVSVWIIVVDEPEITNYSKRFNILFSVYANAVQTLFPEYLNKIKEYSHTLRTIQGQMKQKMEGFAEPKDFRGENYSEQVSNIKLKVSDDLDSAADLICYLNKRIFEIETHIETFDLLYKSNEKNDGFKTEIQVKEVNIKRVLLNIIAPFIQDFDSIGVHVKFHDPDEFFDKNKAPINYKMFNHALRNFLDNALKYIKPYTGIDLYFSISQNSFEIRIEMLSCRVDRDELELIFRSGYSGKHAISPGDGIGMFAMRESLKSFGMTVLLEPDYSVSEGSKNGNQYIKNVFILKGKRIL